MNPTSTTNLKRIASKKEEDVKAREGFFEKLRTDPIFPKVVRNGLNLMMPETFEKGGGMEAGERDSGVDVMREKMRAISVQ